MDMNELIKAQARVVSAAQERLTSALHPDVRFTGGEVKDVGVALAIAVDKLDALIAIRRQGT